MNASVLVECYTCGTKAIKYPFPVGWEVRRKAEGRIEAQFLCPKHRSKDKALATFAELVSKSK